MSEKKHRVEVFFDDEEYAILKELSTGTQLSIKELVYDSVFRAHLDEEAKKRHEAARWLRSQQPIDWGADWAELKLEMERGIAWGALKSMGQDLEPSEPSQ